MTGQSRNPWALFNVAPFFRGHLQGTLPAVPWSSSPHQRICCSPNLFVPLLFSFPTRPAPRPTGSGSLNLPASMPVSHLPGDLTAVTPVGSGRSLCWEACLHVPNWQTPRTQRSDLGPRLGLCPPGAGPAPLQGLCLPCLSVLRSTLTADVKGLSTARNHELLESEAHSPAQGQAHSTQAAPVGRAGTRHHLPLHVGSPSASSHKSNACFPG